MGAVKVALADTELTAEAARQDAKDRVEWRELVKAHIVDEATCWSTLTSHIDLVTLTTFHLPRSGPIGENLSSIWESGTSG